MEGPNAQEKIITAEKEKTPEQSVFEKFENIGEKALENIKKNRSFRNVSESFS